jgi:hypothetical protein
VNVGIALVAGKVIAGVAETKVAVNVPAVAPAVTFTLHMANGAVLGGNTQDPAIELTPGELPAPDPTVPVPEAKVTFTVMVRSVGPGLLRNTESTATPVLTGTGAMGKEALTV